MKIINRIRDDFRTLRAGEPGKRFRHYADKRRERYAGRWNASRVLNCSLGVGLIVVGLAIGWLPGPGGFVAIIGLAFVAQEIPIIADLLDSLEVLGRSLIR